MNLIEGMDVQMSENSLDLLIRNTPSLFISSSDEDYLLHPKQEEAVGNCATYAWIWSDQELLPHAPQHQEAENIRQMVEARLKQEEKVNQFLQFSMLHQPPALKCMVSETTKIEPKNIKKNKIIKKMSKSK